MAIFMILVSRENVGRLTVRNFPLLKLKLYNLVISKNVKFRMQCILNLTRLKFWHLHRYVVLRVLKNVSCPRVQ